MFCFPQHLCPLPEAEAFTAEHAGMFRERDKLQKNVNTFNSKHKPRSSQVWFKLTCRFSTEYAGPENLDTSSEGDKAYWGKVFAPT
jgi:hypothetical protein